MPLTKPKIVEKPIDVNNAMVFSFSGGNVKTQSFNIGDFVPKEIHLYCHSWANNGNVFCGAFWRKSSGGTTSEGLALSMSTPKTKSLSISITDGILKITTAEYMNGNYKLVLFAEENDL